MLRTYRNLKTFNVFNQICKKIAAGFMEKNYPLLGGNDDKGEVCGFTIDTPIEHWTSPNPDVRQQKGKSMSAMTKLLS